jgi:glycolate oxidase iron-sulfur subunit
MRHEIPVASLGPDGAGMARAIETCVHCGFCLPACPTYRVLGEEMDSPRGRIVLMKQALEGGITTADALPYVDRCLGCLSCVTACPSGVRYGELLVPFRARAERSTRPRLERLHRQALLGVLESPRRFRFAARAGLLARRAGTLLPGFARRTLALLPRDLPPPVRLPALVPAAGPRRARVALLAGCAQQVLAPDINAATVRVLSANGVEVVIPPGEACCGALAMHAGHASRARRRGLHLLRHIPADVDAVVSNAAGCGSAMKEYAELLAGTPLQEEAAAFAGRVRDVSEFLDALGLVHAPSMPAPVTVAYHDACHLAHAQQVRAAPRRLLGGVHNLIVREIPDAEICCGSAGLYNLEHPDIAESLGAAKAHAVVTTGAQAVVTGNVGCLVQVAAHLERIGQSIPVLHTMQVLDGGMSRLVGGPGSTREHGRDRPRER